VACNAQWKLKWGRKWRESRTQETDVCQEKMSAPVVGPRGKQSARELLRNGALPL